MLMTDLGHGRGWLDAPAAASIHRIDAQLGDPLPINDAGRTRAEQQNLWDLYWGPNRPDWLYEPARPGESPHESGVSVDIPDPDGLEPIMNDHGWRRPMPESDPVHYNYWPDLDNHLNDPNPAPAPTTAHHLIGEEMFIADMPNGSFLIVPQGNGKPRAVVLDAGSGAGGSGLPRLKFETAGSIGMLTVAVIF